MSKGFKTTIAILTVMVVLGLITLPGLRQMVQHLRSTPKTEEQSRREVLREPISTPTDVEVQAHLYWLSAGSQISLEPTAIQLPLSADPVERSKQLVNALIVRAPAPERRTLPVEASLLAFYIQPDGTAIADFSDDIVAGMPSGILSEELAVQSIALTLGANMTGIRQLKILVHGQEAETLAGHLDLYGMFPVPSPQPVRAPSPASPASPVPAASSAATATPVAKAPPASGGGQNNLAATIPPPPSPSKKAP